MIPCHDPALAAVTTRTDFYCEAVAPSLAGLDEVYYPVRGLSRHRPDGRTCRPPVGGWRSGKPDQAAVERQRDRLRAVVTAKFGHNVVDVTFDGRLAHE